MLAALAFLTPVGRRRELTPDAVPWFPAIGLMLGLVVGGLWWAAARGWSAGVAAALALTADLAVSGMHPVQGLARLFDPGQTDSFDWSGAGRGWGGDRTGQPPRARPQDRRQAGPAGATAAVVVVAAVLLLRWTSMSVLRPSLVLVGGIWCASRTWMAVLAGLNPGGDGARAEGDARPIPVGVLGITGAIAVGAIWKSVAGPVAILSGTAVAAAVSLVARRRLGTVGLHVLGAACVAGETVALLVAAARW